MRESACAQGKIPLSGHKWSMKMQYWGLQAGRSGKIPYCCACAMLQRRTSTACTKWKLSEVRVIEREFNGVCCSTCRIRVQLRSYGLLAKPPAPDLVFTLIGPSVAWQNDVPREDKERTAALTVLSDADCYVVAGGLMRRDDEGFSTVLDLGGPTHASARLGSPALTSSLSQWRSRAGTEADLMRSLGRLADYASHASAVYQFAQEVLELVSAQAGGQ
jgi:hypothetical protein